MSVEIIRYRIAAGAEDAFESAYGEAQRYLAESPVCRSYELLRCEEEPALYLLRIEWVSTDEHLRGFFLLLPDLPSLQKILRSVKVA